MIPANQRLTIPIFLKIKSLGNRRAVVEIGYKAKPLCDLQVDPNFKSKSVFVGLGYDKDNGPNGPRPTLRLKAYMTGG